MSFTISKNKMSFVSDDKVTNLKITCADEKQIEKGTTHTVATVTYDASDVILHGAAQVACSFPNVAVANMPANISLTCTAGGAHGVETLNCTVYTVRSGFLRCATALSSTTPYTEIKLNITAAAAAHFTIPAGSDICMSLIPNEAQLTTTSMPEPPALPQPATPPAITKGFRIPASYAGIYPDIVGEYRFFPYSFDRTGADVTHQDSGIYERSEDDGSTVTVYILLHFKNDGWQTMIMYKRQFTGGEYGAAKTLHLAGTGHLDYSSRVNFDNLPAWATPDPVSGHEYWFPISSYNYQAFSDGVGTIPEHTIPHDSTIVYTEIIDDGTPLPSSFTLSGSGMSGYYTGTWSYAGKVRRVGPSFTASTDIGIYRHDYGTDTYVLYYFAEGVSEAPTWTLTRFGNNQGANAITPTHDFLQTASMTGTHIQYISGSSQTVNGTQYPPSNALGGTMTIG